MDKVRKKNIRRIISLVLFAAVVFLLGAMPLLARQNPESDGPQASILCGAVKTGNISTELITGGTLAEEDPVAIHIPSAVKLTGLIAKNGDTLREGDPIASVDRVTVMTAITQVQETLEYLSEQLEKASEEETDGEVAALAGGTVKQLYAKKGDAAQDVMLEHGALAVLSLDGLMAVDLTVNSDLTAGSSVKVILPSGKKVTGKVQTNLIGEMTVTLTDKDYTVGETVEVTDTDGEVLGSGQLYIFSPWNATAYSGTVESVAVSVGDELDAGETLIELSDIGYSAAYQRLVAQRRAYEELMLELFKMYQTQELTAPCDGVLSGLDENSLQLLSADRQQYQIVFLANAPNGDDESQYVNFVGRVSSVSQERLLLQLNPNAISVTDYKDFASVPVDTEIMTQEVECTITVPVYGLSVEEWVQLEPSEIGAGDILLFACDDSGSFVWIVRIAAAESSEPAEPTDPTVPTEPSAPTEPTDPTVPTEPSTPTEPTEPTVPTDPSTPTEPTDPSTPTEPTDPTVPGTPADPSEPVRPTDKNDPAVSGRPTTPNTQGNSRPSGSTVTRPSNGTGNGTLTYPQGGTVQIPEPEPEFELYGQDVVEIAAITPQSTMTLDVTIDELDITALQPGMSAQVKVDALGGEKFDAVISDIHNTGDNSGGHSKFTVELTLNRSGNMLAGMNATASIVLHTTENVLTVPAEALVEEGTKTVLYTGYDEQTEMLMNPVAVTVGVSDGETVQILEGVSLNTAYYYAYYDTLTVSSKPQFDTGLMPGR